MNTKGWTAQFEQYHDGKWSCIVYVPGAGSWTVYLDRDWKVHFDPTELERAIADFARKKWEKKIAKLILSPPREASVGAP